MKQLLYNSRNSIIQTQQVWITEVTLWSISLPQHFVPFSVFEVKYRDSYDDLNPKEIRINILERKHVEVSDKKEMMWQYFLILRFHLEIEVLDWLRHYMLFKETRTYEYIHSGSKQIFNGYIYHVRS